MPRGAAGQFCYAQGQLSSVVGLCQLKPAYSRAAAPGTVLATFCSKRTVEMKENSGRKGSSELSSASVGPVSSGDMHRQIHSPICLLIRKREGKSEFL